MVRPHTYMFERHSEETLLGSYSLVFLVAVFLGVLLGFYFSQSAIHAKMSWFRSSNGMEGTVIDSGRIHHRRETESPLQQIPINTDYMMTIKTVGSQWRMIVGEGA